MKVLVLRPRVANLPVRERGVAWDDLVYKMIIGRTDSLCRVTGLNMILGWGQLGSSHTVQRHHADLSHAMRPCRGCWQAG